ncbi:DNA excision repair protein ERCC-1 [Cladophialophora yegresii CBS 114405]|uniref:DNA excision repair protein ERCC-1 n=1 Tax=Cladophialophora yegresii CBS 114405 TaxID=1182544 RepID=W9W2E8_9EURO|nr:DNA excision repair protein ERCC-1 [Cladophialophora yegresii CBS 114405]EXJ59175.1 DNA excision repair protein ERCC-1 [Cladophialophora yegresii CBS 114405]
MAEEFDNVDFLSGETSVKRSSAPQRKGSPATNSATKVVQPKPQALPSRQGPSAILVSTRQKGNPILKHVTQLPWEYSDIPCDYVLGATTCALFLSLKYHRLHPEYVYSRIRQLGKLYNLRILLAMVDIENHEEALKELSKTSMINNLTLILCWSSQEAGRYLELFKSYEHASSASIRAHRAETYQESLTEFVTTPRSINKTDAASLIMNFGSLRAAVNAQPEELALVPGFGEKKVKDWYNTLREPFRVRRAAKSNAALLRQETTVGTATSLDTDYEPESAREPIPISSVPTSHGQASNTVMASSDTPAGPSHKRSRPEALDDDFDDDDDEAAWLALAEAEAAKANAEKEQDDSSVPAARKEQELSSGVAAALAKLRQNG